MPASRQLYCSNGVCHIRWQFSFMFLQQLSLLRPDCDSCNYNCSRHDCDHVHGCRSYHSGSLREHRTPTHQWHLLSFRMHRGKHRSLSAGASLQHPFQYLHRALHSHRLQPSGQQDLHYHFSLQRNIPQSLCQKQCRQVPFQNAG